MDLIEVSRLDRLGQVLPDALIKCTVDKQVRAGTLVTPLTVE